MENVENKSQFVRLFNRMLEQENYSEASSLIDNCSDILGDGDYELFTGRIYYKNKSYLEAESIAIQGLKRAPSHYGLYRLLGETIGEIGEVDSAKRCLQGSMLDNYITQKFFSEESHKLQHASEDLSRLVYDEDSKELPDLVCLSEQAPRKEFSASKILHAKPSVFLLEGGKVWFDGHNLCVFNSDDELISPCTMGNPLLIESIRHKVPLTKIPGNLAVVVARSCDNYFHWTTDVAPGFHLVQKVCDGDEELNKYLLSHSDKSFQTDFMQLNGIVAEQVIRHGVENGCYFAADKLWVPVFRHRMAMGMGRWAIDYLRSIAPEEAADAARKRIYISRRDVKSRGVENEDELIDFLVSYGFEDVSLDGMSVQQQMALFRDCEFVFAPHGAGLTNLIYCSEGTKVVEFFADFVQPCFRSLACLANLEYGHFSVSEPATAGGTLAASKRKHVIQHKSYAVSLSDVEAILAIMGCDRVDRVQSA